VLRLPDLAVDFVFTALLLEPLGGGVLGKQVVRQRGWAGSGGCAEQGRGGGVWVVLSGVVFVVLGWEREWVDRRHECAGHGG